MHDDVSNGRRRHAHPAEENKSPGRNGFQEEKVTHLWTNDIARCHEDVDISHDLLIRKQENEHGEVSEKQAADNKSAFDKADELLLISKATLEILRSRAGYARDRSESRKAS